MAMITIRNLSAEVVERLKTVAKRNGRSMEQEAREILQLRLASRYELFAEMRSRWDNIAAPPSASEVSDWIAAGRRGAE